MINWTWFAASTGNDVCYNFVKLWNELNQADIEEHNERLCWRADMIRERLKQYVYRYLEFYVKYRVR